jgi:hypothetical protein
VGKGFSVNEKEKGDGNEKEERSKFYWHFSIDTNHLFGLQCVFG